MTAILSNWPTITADKLIRFVLFRNAKEDAPFIIRVVTAYVDLAPLYGIDPAAVVAQMCLETGYLSSAWSLGFNNFAGIGVTGAIQATNPGKAGWTQWSDGNWHEGHSFANPEAGVDAHLGHLFAYCFPTHNARCLITDPRHYRVTPHPNKVKNIVDLNGVGWATGNDYGTKIQAVYDAMKAS